MHWRRFGIWGGAILLLGLLILLRRLLPPFAVALALAYLLDPLLDRLETRGYSRVRAIGLVYGLFSLLFLLGVLFIVPTLVNQINTLVQNFDSYVHNLQKLALGWSSQADRWVEKLPVAAEHREKIHRYIEDLRTLWGQGSAPSEAGRAWMPLQWIPLAPETSRMQGPPSPPLKGAIAGQVTRQRGDGRFVVVWVDRPYRATATDEEGRYELTDLEPGTYTVRARYGDLVQTFPQQVEVRPGFKTTPVDLELTGRSHLNLTWVTTWVAERLKRLLLGVINSLSSWLSFLLLLPIATFYFLRDYDPLRRRLFALVPSERQPLVADLTAQINRTVGGYLRGLCIVSGLVGLETTLLLFLSSLVFGTKYWLLLGLLTGLLSVIPYFGMPLAAFLTALINYLTGGWGAATASLVGIFVINIISDSIVSPRIIGQQVGLPPLLMIFTLLAGGSLFGITGMILAGPVVASLKVIVVHFWPALTSPLPPESPPPPPPRQRFRRSPEPKASEENERAFAEQIDGGSRNCSP